MPAARLGDTTAHGGVIVAGEPTVLIGGAPAARVGDMHTCPIPGGPPPPHVGGPITLGSFTVLIGGKPAARVGDMCTCTGPPDSIVMGCTTVLIGTSGGGGGAGMAGKGGKKGEGLESAEAGKSKELADGSGAEDEAETENHYLDVKFKDKGGKPITGVAYKIDAPDNQSDQGNLYGKVKKTGVEPGDYDIELKGVVNAEWSQTSARVGDVVKLSADVAGYEDGTPAVFQIYERDLNGPDKALATKKAQVSGGKVETQWEYPYLEDPDDYPKEGKFERLSSPKHIFVVTVGDQQARSGLIEFKDYIEIELKDEDGRPIANEAYILYLANGEVREGTLDANGYKKEEKVPPCEWDITFPNLQTFLEED